MNAFVGVTTVETLEDIKTYLQPFQAECYWFLKWPHQVSGFISEPPEQLSPEGQLLHSDYEFRWKPSQDQYSLLLLAKEGQEGFRALEGQWQSQDVPGLLHKSSPRLAQLKGEQIQVKQRYFIDSRTETIHFVALVPHKS